MSLPCTALFIDRPVELARLLATMQPAPHRLPADARHCALPVAALDGLLDAALRSRLPPELHSMRAKRLAAYVAGRLCAEYALGKLGLRNHSIARAPTGEPIWPAGVVGSIAHTDLTAYAAAWPSPQTGGLGIDSEPQADADAVADIRHVCCTEWENERWFGHGEADAWTATALFCAKEAYYKAIHSRVRRVVEFTEVEVRAIDPARQHMSIVPVPGTLLARDVSAATALCSMTGNTLHAVVTLRAPA